MQPERPRSSGRPAGRFTLPPRADRSASSQSVCPGPPAATVVRLDAETTALKPSRPNGPRWLTLVIAVTLSWRCLTSAW